MKYDDDVSQSEQSDASAIEGVPDTNYHHEGGNMPAHGHHDLEVFREGIVDAYWKANIALLVKLLTVWFVVSFGFGILLVDVLNQIPFFGFKLGFWFAQQGSILAFVALIFIYSFQMKRLERRFGIDDDD